MSEKIQRRLMIGGFVVLTVVGIGLGVVTGGLLGLTFTAIGAMCGLVSVVGIGADLHYSSMTPAQQRRHDAGVQRWTSSYRQLHERDSLLRPASQQPAIMQSSEPAPSPQPQRSLWARIKTTFSRQDDASETVPPPKP